MKVNAMRRLMSGVLVLNVLLLAACGGTPADETLPTLAQLPTQPPPATTAPAVNSSSSESVVTPDSAPTVLVTRPSVADATNSGTPQLPESLQGMMTATLPFEVDMDVFPPMAVGDLVTLRGLLTVEDGVSIMTDTEGNRVTVLVDPFVADVANGQMIEIRGSVIAQDDGQAVQMTAITVLPEATPELGGVPPLPTEGVPPLPTEGVPPLPTEGVPPLPTPGS